MSASTTRQPGLAANLVWNLGGESMPVFAAVVAIPILVHRLGADRFGVLTLSWAVAGYFGLFDFGLGRALTKAMAQELSIGRGAKAATLFWTVLAMMLALGGVAGVTLAMLAPWLTRDALRIPLVLQDETLEGLNLIAIGLPILVSLSALRAALTAADRFDLLNVIRTPSGIMSFVAPVLMLPFTHRLSWLIAVLVINRAISWIAYAAAIPRALPDLTSHFGIDVSCALPLLGFGAWITVSSVITPMMLYADRFFIGALLSVSALAAYSIPMEIVSKSFLLPAAVSGVMFPAFARSFATTAGATRALFARSLKLIALVLFPVCAAAIAFAPQIISIWIGSQLAPQSAAVLQILAVGAFITGLAWIPLALLHAAHRPDLPAKIHLADFPIYAMMLWLFIRRFGLAGAALVWSGRLMAENLIVFAMAAGYLAPSRREIAYASALLLLAIATMTGGAFITELQGKAVFVGTLAATSVLCAWRFLLDGPERAWIMEMLPAIVRPALTKVEN